MINSRFAVAVHLLALLASGRTRFPGLPLTSEVASESVNTNPVVVRRILGSLRRAGLVSSHSGPAGGWALERAPDEITLRDVYCAVEDENLFSMHHRSPSPTCTVGRNIQVVLQGFFQEAEAAMAAKLEEKTIADVLGAVETCAAHGVG